MALLDGNKATLELFMSDRDDLMRVAFLDDDGRVYVRSIVLNQMLKDMLIVLKDKIKRSIETDKRAGKIRYNRDAEEIEVRRWTH